ncbi:MAG: glycosyltransferase [Cyanobacteria bacterium J06600_6]
MNTEIKIAISWSRLPPYAAKLIAKAINISNQPVTIISSKPAALQAEVEQCVSQPIVWVDINQDISWSDLKMDVPQIFFQSGWFSTTFTGLGSEVKRNGGKVICITDNCWKNTLRQWIGALVFRLRYRNCFDAVWVPGKSGTQLMRFYGMPKNKIYQGLYSSDPQVFYSQKSIDKRGKKFIFVGQLIERKGIRLLIRAFSKFTQNYPEWKLHVIGNGVLVDELLEAPNIVYEGFKAPKDVAKSLRNSRFLILPSYEEHWGLVVHEAALSGCGLITSDTVGSYIDLVDENNGIVFKNNSVDSLYKAMMDAASFEDEKLQLVQTASQSKASEYSPFKWAETFIQIVSEFDSETIEKQEHKSIRLK